MKIKQIVKLFNDGNVMVCGERGAGKDMLFANVIARRKLPYVSNCHYKRKGCDLTYYPLEFDKIDCGGNTYKNFIDGNLKPYTYPYPKGADVYITDAGVYLPAQFCSELNRDYKHIPTFMALSRHLGLCNVHVNSQSISRVFDKIREQSRTYVMALNCRVIPIFKSQYVIQKVRIYDKYESAVSNVPALRLPLSMRIGKDKTLARLYKLNYEIQHGFINEGWLIYKNQSDYDTYVFESMLKGAGTNVNEKA